MCQKSCFGPSVYTCQMWCLCPSVYILKLNYLSLFRFYECLLTEFKLEFVPVLHILAFFLWLATVASSLFYCSKIEEAFCVQSALSLKDTWTVHWLISCLVCIKHGTVHGTVYWQPNLFLTAKLLKFTCVTCRYYATNSSSMLLMAWWKVRKCHPVALSGFLLLSKIIEIIH